MTALSKFKPYFFVIFFFVIFSIPLIAQKEPQSHIGTRKEFLAFGPKISANFTQENPLHGQGPEFMPGADLGLFFRLRIARFYVQPEVHYVIRSHYFQPSYPHWLHGSHDKYETNHLSVPIFVGIRAVDLRIFKIRVFVGPECNFPLHKGSDEHFQLGLQTGLGFDIWRFTIDAAYSVLSNLEEKRFTKTSANNIFKIGVGFKCF